MKAAVIKEKNNICIEDVPMPVLNDGEALIKVRYCGICGSDIHVFKGEHPTAKFPVVPGHEFTGAVAAVKGQGAEQFAVGDMVVAQPFFSCGHCESCAQGRDNVCRQLAFMGAHVNGGFAEYVKVLTRKMYKVPQDMEPQLAALAEPVAVAVHDVRRSNLKVGETALVIGGGPIGMLIAIIAEEAGAGKVVISELSAARRAFAEELGYTSINPLDSNFERELSAMTDGKGFDVTYEVSGSKPGITTALTHTKIAGTVMVIGMTSEPYPVNLSQIFAKELKLQGVRIHDQYNFIGAVELLKNGKCNDKFKRLISRIYKLEEIEEAFEYSGTPGDYFKVLVEM